MVAGYGAGWREHRTALREKTSVTVSAKYSRGIGSWFDTHFNVETGSILSIETKGKWTLGGGPRTCDANGLTNFADYKGFPPGILLGRIGENGRVFAVGKSYKSTVYDPGRLYLSNNDRNVKDNSGELEVTIRTWSND